MELGWNGYALPRTLTSTCYRKSGFGETGDEGGSGVVPPNGPGARAIRFRGSKHIDPSRALRDKSLISDEILALFTTNVVPVQITVDVESSAIESLTGEQLTALRENLATLGFTDWSVE